MKQNSKDFSEMLWWLNYFNPFFLVALMCIFALAIFLWTIRWSWIYKLLYDYFVIRPRIMKSDNYNLRRYYQVNNLFNNGTWFDSLRGKNRKRWILKARLNAIKCK